MLCHYTVRTKRATLSIAMKESTYTRQSGSEQGTTPSTRPRWFFRNKFGRFKTSPTGDLQSPGQERFSKKLKEPPPGPQCFTTGKVTTAIVTNEPRRICPHQKTETFANYQPFHLVFKTPTRVIEYVLNSS